ncbi:MAG: hypothetical protein LBG92_06745, partial [Prevotellaceae bacterium]|nr:hypothetical protein [Prevotellaceae bacterium]
KAEPCGAENIKFWLSASFLGLCLSVCQTTYGYENSGFQPVFWGLCLSVCQTTYGYENSGFQPVILI